MTEKGEALPYDKGDKQFIYHYALDLRGSTLREKSDAEQVADIRRNKGSFGDAVEYYYFSIDNNSDSVPDFKEADIELKTTQLRRNKDGSLSSKECLVIGMIDYMEVVDETFETSHMVEEAEIDIPDVDMVVGGFPCQDYSVAKPLSQAGDIEGKKGVLWWDIYRFLHLKEPKYVLLENVDRLLKNPASQRGRDFAIMLTCLADLGCSVEWRVVNGAEYGFPQRRKRVCIYAEFTAEKWNIEERISKGVLSSALPIQEPEGFSYVELPEDPYIVTNTFNVGGKGKSPFGTAECIDYFCVATCDLVEDYRGERRTLGDVMVPQSEVPESFFVPEGKLEKWRYLKGSKSEDRTKKTPDGTEVHVPLLVGLYGLPRPAREPLSHDFHRRGRRRCFAFQAHRRD